ncbi:MAG: beta-N-acetylhexosaminidase [Armatimonadota bacterium]
MRNLSLAIVVAFLCICTGNASAEPTGSTHNTKVGKWNLSFTHDLGFILSYNNVNIIRSTGLTIHNGNSNSQYFSYYYGNNDISVQDIAQGKVVTIKHSSKSFSGSHTITLLPDRVIFQFDYALPKEITDGKMNMYALLSAQPIAGRAYQASGTKGDISGIIPVHWEKSGKNYAPDYLTEATFDSVLGKLKIKVEGDLIGLRLLDYRSGEVGPSRWAPIFRVGIFNKDIEPGINHSQTITVSIEPAPEKERTARMPQGGEIKVIPTSNVQTPPSDMIIIPEPKELKLLAGDFRLNADTKIVVADDATEKDYSGALLFTSDVFALSGLDLKIIRESQAKNNSNVILVGEPGRNKILGKAAKADGINPPSKDEGYALSVAPERVVVAGFDRAGSFYGMQTLRQIVRSQGDQVYIPGCRVNDWPSLKFRGVHLYTGKDAPAFHKKLIDRILTKYKYNYLIMDCSYMQWKTNPDLAMDYAESQEDVKKEVAYAGNNFLEVIPLVATLGHAEWMFKNGQNLNLVEDKSCHYAYCPSKEETYDFIFKIYDEAINVFKPKYFHIGHDEVANRGKFPTCDLCKDKSMTELMCGDIRRIHDYFSKKGIRMMMWGDMLLADGEASSSKNAPNAIESKKRRDLIPKDVIITDWHYDPARVQDYNSLKVFQDAGFDVIASTWYTPRNIWSFANAAKANHSMGHLLTLWVGTNSNEQNLVGRKEQFNAMVLGGEFAWNDGKTGLENLPYDFTEVFDQSYERKQPAFVIHDGFMTDISAYYNVKLADNPQGSGWAGLGPGDDLSNAPVGSAILKGIRFRLADSTSKNSAIRVASSMDTDAVYPEKVSIPLNTKAHSLFFLHTTARCDAPVTKSGYYIAHYSDGTQVDIPLIYRNNITAWTDPSECPNAMPVWSMQSKADETLLLRVFEWTNPSPDKTIAFIDMVPSGTEAGMALLGISGTN